MRPPDKSFQSIVTGIEFCVEGIDAGHGHGRRSGIGAGANDACQGRSFLFENGNELVVNDIVNVRFNDFNVKSERFKVTDQKPLLNVRRDRGEHVGGVCVKVFLGVDGGQDDKIVHKCFWYTNMRNKM